MMSVQEGQMVCVYAHVLTWVGCHDDKQKYDNFFVKFLRMHCLFFSFFLWHAIQANTTGLSPSSPSLDGVRVILYLFRYGLFSENPSDATMRLIHTIRIKVESDL